MEFKITIAENVNLQLTDHLIREDGQEDLCFALYNLSQGDKSESALIFDIILPEKDDRQIHGNVSFNPQYFIRACKIASEKKCGLAFLHSHPFPGWQNMSLDDVKAESTMAPSVETITNLPLVGLTVGCDGTWSGRIWKFNSIKYTKKWAAKVKIIGKELRIYFDEKQVAIPKFKEEFKRTISVWGKECHRNLTGLRIGIIGLGSVGSIVAESLSRMGLQFFTLIDFDEVQKHNLDRSIGPTIEDIGRLKIDIIERQIQKTATANNIEIRKYPFSIVEESGYKGALDCDVIFSCVDRPWARNVLNHIAYNHMIPVIDGGIGVRFNKTIFEGADWQIQTVGPTKPCLQCLGAYEPADVSTEKEGLLDDPSYLANLEVDHSFKRNENIFPFSLNLASLEVFHFIELVTGIGGEFEFGVQRYRYNHAVISRYTDRKCHSNCDFKNSVAQADKWLSVTGVDISAVKARERQQKK